MSGSGKIDFQNPSTALLFGFCMQTARGWEVPKNVDYNIERVPFRDILVKYDLPQYTDFLLDYQTRWFDFKKNLFVRHRAEFDERERNLLPHKLKIATALKMLLAGEEKNFKDMEFSLSGLYRVNISEPGIFKSLKEVFFQEFEDLGLNETALTKEEAIEEINSLEHYDDEWFFNNGLEYDVFKSESEEFTEYYIEKYRQEHVKARVITSDVVENAIRDLESWQEDVKSSPGAKVKNLEIGALAWELSFLHRISEFLKQDEYSTIKDFPLPNETCRFIYAYFEFLGLLPELINYDESQSENRGKYISSLIRNYKKLSKSQNLDHRRDMVILDVNREMEVDLFKMVKDGLRPQEDFFNRFPLYKY